MHNESVRMADVLMEYSKNQTILHSEFAVWTAETMRPLDTLFSAVWWTTGVSGFVLNVLLLTLIKTRSPPSLTPYKIILANNAITDLVFGMSTTFLQCRLIPNKWAFAYIALGPSKYFGAQVSYYSYVVQLHSLFYLFLSFPISFGFRYYVLVRSPPKSRHVVMLLFCVWLMPLAQLISFVLSQSDSDAIRAYLKINKPYYDLSQYVISGNHMIWQPMTPITLGTIVLPMFPIYVLVMYFHRKVHKFLDTHSSTMVGACMAQSKRSIHCRVSKKRRSERTSDSSGYLVYSLFSFMPVGNPIICIYFVRPYRVAVLRVFNRAVGRPPPNNHSSAPAKSVPRRTLSTTL